MKVIQLIEIFVIKHWKLLFKIGIGVIVLFYIIKEGSHQIQNVNLYETFKTLRNLSFRQVLIMLCFGLLATATMTLYDFTVIRYFHHTIKPLLMFNIAFVANSLNNLLGMGGLAGATARTVLLRKNNLDFKTSVYYNTLIIPATPTGLSLLALFLISESKTMAVITSRYPWILFGVIGMILLLPIFFFSDKIIDHFHKGNNQFVMHKSLSLKIKLLLISFIEWFSAALFFYYITRLYSENANFILILMVYSIASIAGIMSFLPGGVGSFDLIALIGLQFFDVGASDALAILVLFRIFYYLIPAFTSVVFLFLNLTMARNEKLFSYSFITNIGFFNNVLQYFKTYSDFMNVLLSMLVFSSGLVLLFSAIKPGIADRILFLTKFLSKGVLQFSHIVSIIIGFLLLVLAFEILYKVKRAYRLSIYLLLIGSVFTFLKGLDFEEGIFLLIVLFLVKVSKPSFYRFSIPTKLSKILMVSIVGLVSIMFYFVINKNIHFAFVEHNLYPTDIFGNDGDLIMQGLVTYIVFLLFLIGLYVTKPKIENDPLYAAPNFTKLSEFLTNHKGDALTHLMYLGDKKMFWSSDEQILIAYAKYNDIIVVLGDPIGNKEGLSNGIREFQEFLDRYGFEAVFYEVSDQNLTTYHDNGYYFFKLGEEAIVDLEKFNLHGASKSAERYKLNRFTKNGFTFEILNPPFGNELIDELQEVSNEWLANRAEKGFSLGWFEHDYLQLSPIAVLRDKDLKLLAFVSLMPSYDGQQSMSTDLMRIRNDVPHGSMDFMILNLFLYYKERNFKYFNLGMAPLSNVGLYPNSHFQEKIARLAFKYGNFFYSFEGLRKYKEKYDPIWKPRYLAYPQLLSLPATLIEISMLVASKGKMKH